MSYMTSVSEEEAKEKQRRLDEENERVFQLICDRTDQTPGTAFKNALINWMNGRLSIDGYDMLCATSALPEFSDKRWHQGTLEFYVKLCIDKLRDRNWSDDDIRRKAAELYNKTKPEVRAYLQELGFREQVRTLDEAKSFLARHRLLESQQKFYFTKDGTRFERLPSLVVAPGHVQARPLDALFLYKILDGSGLRRYCERYSSEQISERAAQTASSLRGE